MKCLNSRTPNGNPEGVKTEPKKPAKKTTKKKPTGGEKNA